MKIVEKEFMSVLLGSDINTYSMARAFHEEYGIKSRVMGKFFTGPSYRSKIVDFYADPKMDQREVFIKAANDFANEHKDKKIILLGCGDNYVRQIIECRDELADNYIIPYINRELMERLIKKEEFYKMCEKYGILYPKTFIYSKDMNLNYTLDFDFPMILKPSNSVDYFAHEFETQHKVYKIESKEELDKVIKQIYDAGYSDTLIMQEFIPGDDTYMRVMTGYANKNGKVELMCLGHTMLEEHTPHGIGNHAVVMTEYNPDLANKLKVFLEDIHYTGFFNFDIKYCEKDNTFRVFEINVRQGRSNYYVTGAGYNLAKYIVEDYIYNKEHEYKIAENIKLRTIIPIVIAYKNVDEKNVKQIKELKKEGKFVNPLFYKGDNKILRTAALVKSQLRHYGNYKKYLKK